MSTSITTAVLVSFYTNTPYYEQAARELRRDCERLGLAHDIVPLDAVSHLSWIDICRRKVPFFLQMQRKHQRPIFWLDVDSRLAQAPDFLKGTSADIAGFLRGCRYLRDFDSLSVPRFFAPFALYFNMTVQATRFLELMTHIEREFSGSATDDFFLQEAWRQHRDQLSALILAPDLVGSEWPLRDRQIIRVGISGNAGDFKSQAQQHPIEMLAPQRRKTVLLHEAKILRRAGQIREALVLFELALQTDLADTDLADMIQRLRRQHDPAT